MDTLNNMKIEKHNGLIIAKHSGTILKRLNANGFEGYSIRWHDPYRIPDKTGNSNDLYGEWFSPKTNRMLKAGYPIIGIPVNYQHGLHKADGSSKDFGATGIGLLDFTDEDEIGQFVRGELFAREQYIEMLREIGRLKEFQISDSQYAKRAEMAVKAVDTLLASVPVQFSGGFDPSTWLVNEETKHIDQAGHIHLAFTPTPADDLNPIVSFKSMFSEALSLEHERKTFDMSTPADTSKDAQHIEKQADTNSFTAGSTGDVSFTIALNTLPIAEGGLIKPTVQISQKSTKQGLKNMELWNQLLELIAKLGASLGYVAEGESEAMANAVVDELKADPETPKEEDLKEMPPEEVAKAADDLAEKAVKKFNAIVAKKQAQKDAIAKAFDARIKQAERQEPPLDPYGAGGMRSEYNQKRNNQISVSESLKYAHLSAEDMAMAWKMAVAAEGLGVRGFAGRRATDFVSEEFYRTAMHKMVNQVERNPLKRGHEELEVKAAMPFRANELNASDITGQGLEWLGYAYDSQVWEAARNIQVYKEMMARGMLEKPVAQGMKGAYVPIESDDLTVYGGTEANSVDATGRPEVVYKIQPQTTSTVLVQPGTFRTATAYTFQLQEDSFVDMAQEANRKIRLALEENIERAFINADSDATASTNINKIDGTPTASGLQKDYYLEFDGLRKSPLVTSTTFSTSGGTLTTDDYLNTWALLGSNIAPHKESIFFLIDFSTFKATMPLLDVKTKDVAGDQSTLFTGKMSELWGIPVLMSGFLALSNTAGKISVTAGNNTKGQILAVYAPYWAFVFKRNLTIEMQRSPDSETFEFYGSMRFALKRRSAAASAITYNLTV